LEDSKHQIMCVILSTNEECRSGPRSVWWCGFQLLSAEQPKEGLPGWLAGWLAGYLSVEGVFYLL